MAWTGTPTVVLVSDRVVRITGVSLAAGQAGTIGLDGSGAQIELPDGFDPTPYTGVTLADSVLVSFVHTDPGGGGESRHVHVDKVASPFLITITNDSGTLATSPLEIYVRYH